MEEYIDIGDGNEKTFIVKHTHGNIAHVNVIEKSTCKEINPNKYDIKIDKNDITISFAVAPKKDEYQIVIYDYDPNDEIVYY